MTNHPPVEANLELTIIERDFLVKHLANFADVLDVLWNSGYWYHEIPLGPEGRGLLTWIKDIDRHAKKELDSIVTGQLSSGDQGNFKDYLANQAIEHAPLLWFNERQEKVDHRIVISFHLAWTNQNYNDPMWWDQDVTKITPEKLSDVLKNMQAFEADFFEKKIAEFREVFSKILDTGFTISNIFWHESLHGIPLGYFGKNTAILREEISADSSGIMPQVTLISHDRRRKLWLEFVGSDSPWH